jgi:hypothetical protein
MAGREKIVHVVNDKGAVVCPRKDSPSKAKRKAWDALPKAKQCVNCRRVLDRKEGREKVHFGTVSIRRSRDRNGRKLVTGDPLASYTPRYGQV